MNGGDYIDQWENPEAIDPKMRGDAMHRPSFSFIPSAATARACAKALRVQDCAKAHFHGPAARAARHCAMGRFHAEEAAAQAAPHDATARIRARVVGQDDDTRAAEPFPDAHHEALRDAPSEAAAAVPSAFAPVHCVTADRHGGPGLDFRAANHQPPSLNPCARSSADYHRTIAEPEDRSARPAYSRCIVAGDPIAESPRL
jgi:hypothetical protein